MHDFTKKLVKNLLISITFFFIVILIGAAIIGSIENWSFLDSFYMMTVTSTTIGYGDFTPQTDAGKLFISFYSLLSVGSFLYIFSLIAVTNAKTAVN
jgi:voltage-gated potassium channel